MNQRLDAVRGIANECRFRGGIRELLAHPEFAAWERRAAKREAPQHNITRDLPDWPVIGLGTYGWAYDTRLLALPELEFIDTAEGYGYGKVEEALGREDLKRFFLATKVARTHMSRDSILRAAQRSIKRLGRPIDLYQVHWPNPEHGWAEVMGAFVELKQRGCIRHLGLCNVSVDQIIAAERALPANLKITSVQVRYSLMEREIEDYLLPWCQERGIIVIAYSPLGQKFTELCWHDINDALGKIAKERGVSRARIALSWIISKPGIVAIPRTNSMDHLIDNLAATPLEPAEIGRLNNAFRL